MNISEKIKKMRKSKNLTQEQLAEKINVSRIAVAKRETNRTQPNNENIIIISDFFNITIDELLKNS